MSIHILRNPHGWSEEAQREARLQAADTLESHAQEIADLRRMYNQIWDGLRSEQERAIEQTREIESLKEKVIYHEAYAEECMDSFNVVMAEKKELRAALVESADALEYHQEQTRPIAKTQAALTRCKEILK